MARSGPRINPATSNHLARPNGQTLGQKVLNTDWRINLDDIDFAPAFTHLTRKQILEAELNTFIGQGYDVQRTKDRLLRIAEINPDRDFHDELAAADGNLIALAEMVTATQQQIDALDA